MATGDETTSSLVLNRYRVEAQRDEGDLGTVMQAYDTQLGRQVEIRAPRRDATTTDLAQAREQFANEAEAGVRIGARDEIVAVLDLASSADDIPYLIREDVVGGPLAEHLVQRGALPLSEAVTITRDVARALMATHDVGIVHRDVRPANIYLTDDEHAKLGGFAFAQIENSARSVSLESMVALSPDALRYQVPEQEHGTEAARPSADQYSLGLVFFEMLIGVPFKELEPDAAWARAAWQSPAVFACLKRMTMDNPTERYPSMATVIGVLDRIAHKNAGDTSPALVLPPLSLSAEPMPVDGPHDVPLPARPVLPAAVTEPRAVPVTTAPLPVVSTVERSVAVPPRRTQRARTGGLILIVLFGAILLARVNGGGSRPSPAATATVISAGAVAVATAIPALTPSAAPTPTVQPTPTALVGAATATVRLASVVPAMGSAGMTSTPPPMSPAPATMSAATPTVVRVTPGVTTGVPATTVGAATRVPEAVMTVVSMPTPVPTMIPATATATPLPPAPASALSNPSAVLSPPTLVTPASTLGVQSVGTTNQALTTITPQDSVIQFAAGQEVFGWINFGGAAAGQDMLDATVLAGGAAVGTQQVTLVQPDGFAVFSLGSLPAGQYTLQVRYRGNVVRESTFTVTSAGATAATQPRIVPTAAPRVVSAAPTVGPTEPPVVVPATTVPIVAAPPVVMAPPPTTPPVVVAPPAVPTAAPPVIPVAPPMVIPTPPTHDN